MNKTQIMLSGKKVKQNYEHFKDKNKNIDTRYRVKSREYLTTFNG